MSLNDRLRLRLGELARQGLSRSLPPVSHRQGVAYELGSRPVVGFCSNDYLGLASVPAPRTDLAAGASASRLICGEHGVHREVEAALAQLANAEDAVLFPSGFQLNVGVLPALIEGSDVVFSDTLNHASLIDGLRLARARPQILPHAQVPPSAVASSASALRWWVTESVYSMDGDAIDPAKVQEFEASGGCAYVDDAHGFGLYEGGQGLLGSRGVNPTLLVGTLSKAFGCAGAFIAGSATACHYIRTRARSFVFSTGVSPSHAAAILDRISRVRSADGDARRQRLWTNIARLSAQLGVPTNPSPIFPIMVGANELAVNVDSELLACGFHVQAIRPPTVPDGTARLRLTVCADHTEKQIDGVAAAVLDLLRVHDVGLPGAATNDRPSAQALTSGTPSGARASS